MMQKGLILQQFLAVHKGLPKSIDLRNTTVMMDEYLTYRTYRRLNRAIFYRNAEFIIK